MSESITPTGPTGPAPKAPSEFTKIETAAGTEAEGLWAKIKSYFSGSVIATAIGAGVAGLLVGHFLIP